MPLHLRLDWFWNPKDFSNTNGFDSFVEVGVFESTIKRIFYKSEFIALKVMSGCQVGCLISG